MFSVSNRTYPITSPSIAVGTIRHTLPWHAPKNNPTIIIPVHLLRVPRKQVSNAPRNAISSQIAGVTATTSRSIHIGVADINSSTPLLAFSIWSGKKYAIVSVTTLVSSKIPPHRIKEPNIPDHFSFRNGNAVFILPRMIRIINTPINASTIS